MSSIVKITVTANVESDILNKEAGLLVSDAVKQLTPALVEAFKSRFVQTPKVSEAPSAKPTETPSPKAAETPSVKPTEAK